MKRKKFIEFDKLIIILFLTFYVFTIFLPSRDVKSFGSADFSVSVVGKDALTNSENTKIGDNINWTIKYLNQGVSTNPAKIYFPVKENQEFILGSVNVPDGWSVTYSTDSSCTDTTFTYTPSGTAGNRDPQIKCIRLQSSGDINTPANSSIPGTISTRSNTGTIDVSSLGGTDVWYVNSYKDHLYFMNHHTFSGTPGRPQLYCFDLSTSAACIPAAGSPITNYPVRLGLDGLDAPDQRALATSRVASSLVLNDKLYFPYADCDTYSPDPITGCSTNIDSGGGIMCWDLQTDNYCSGDGLNVRGQIKLHNFNLHYAGLSDWFIAGNVYATTYDIVYNQPTNEIYSLATDGSIVCYSLTLGAPCAGEPYATSITSMPGYRTEGTLVIANNRAYAVLNNEPDEIGCIDLLSKAECSDFTTPRIISKEITGSEVAQLTTLFTLNNQMCAFVSQNDASPSADATGVYCYNESSHLFESRFPFTHNRNLFPEVSYLNLQDYPGRLYIPVGGATVVYCFDTTTEQQCSGWTGGLNAANGDDSLYSISYKDNCLWASGDDGHIYPINPVDGSVCDPVFPSSAGSTYTILDASSFYCSTPDADVKWYNLVFNDNTSTPSPTLLTAKVYDLSNCTINPLNIVCTGAPLKTQNLLLNTGHDMDLSDISYAQHKRLAVTIDYSYPSIPSPVPDFYIDLLPQNQPESCLTTELVFSGSLCSSPISTVCGEATISSTGDPDPSNNTSRSCLNVQTYFGKDPNSAVCFVASSGIKVTNPNAVVSRNPVSGPIQPGQGNFPGSGGTGSGDGGGNPEPVPVEEVTPGNSTDLLKTVTDIIKNTKPVTPLLVTAASAVAVTAIVGTSLLTSNASIIQLIGVILGFLSARRRKYWGIVYDAKTNKVVPFASITLTKKELGNDSKIHTKILAQTVTDLEGRYRLNTDQRDNFFLEIRASGYEIYYKFIKMEDNHSPYEDIIYDVPLKRLEEEGSVALQVFGYQKNNTFKLLRIIGFLSAILGFVVTIYSEVSEHSLFNVLLLVLYVVIFLIIIYPLIYNFILKRGYVIEKTLNTKIAGAVVRVYDQKQQLALSFTNSKGEVRFDLNPGSYGILANKRGYEMNTNPGEKLLKGEIKKEGYFDRNISMKKLELSEGTSPVVPAGQLLDNPFS